MDACESEGVEITSIQHCYSSTELYGVNPREPLGGQPTSNDAVGQALCVVQKNTAIPVSAYSFVLNGVPGTLKNAMFHFLAQEEFFDAAGVVESNVFTTAEGQKAYSYLASEMTSVSFVSVCFHACT